VNQATVTSRLDTVDDVCARLRAHGRYVSDAHARRGELPAPRLDRARSASRPVNAMLAYEPFARHMTDEGHQMQQGLALAGYQLYGPGFLNRGSNDAGYVSYVSQCGTMIVQDQREWDSSRIGCFDKGRDFTGLPAVAERPDIFRVAVHKDAHQDPQYHKRSHETIQPHAWVHYYHPKIVKLLAPWMRERHMIRTWHTVDPGAVPEFSTTRPVSCVLSGSLSSYYPLRARLAQAANRGQLGDVLLVRHPGYGSRGSKTPAYLELLSTAKVAICTASALGYTLRKVVEATACGCRVISNIAVDDPYPHVDQNITRVPSDITVPDMRDVIELEVAAYDPRQQAQFAAVARTWYDYRTVGEHLAARITEARGNYAP
jgi:hypothetical protein